MKRYYKLEPPLPKNLYCPGCPVIIAAGALLKDIEKESILAQLKFKNIGDKIIKSIKVTFKTFDIKSNIINECFEYQYSDLALGFNSEYLDKKGVDFNNPTIRNFEVYISKIVFNNGSIWEEKAKVFESLPTPKDLVNKLGEELALQYKRDVGEHSKYEPFVYDDIWCCTCGEYNRIDESNCHSCNTEKTKQFLNLDHSVLYENRKAYLKVEQKKEEKKRIKTEEESKKKRKKLIVYILSILLIIGIIFCLEKYS